MTAFILKFGKAFLKPLRSNWIFFIIFGLLIAGNATLVPVRFPHGGWHYYWGPALEGLARAMVLSYLVTALVGLCGSPMKLKIVLYVCAAMMFTVTTYMIMVLGRTFSPDVILLMVETTSAESSEFFRQYLLNAHGLLYLALFLAILAFAVCMERRQVVLSRVLTEKAWRKYICICLLTIVISGGIYKIAETVWLVRSSMMRDVNRSNLMGILNLGQRDWAVCGQYSDTMTNLCLSAIFLRELGESTRMWERLQKDIIADYPSGGQPDSLSVVFVLGESHSKIHSSLYAYPLCTNPRMEKERDRGNLYLFQDVVTPYCSTTEVIKNVLSVNSVGDGEAWQNHACFPLLFKLSGYNVQLWDNQNDMFDVGRKVGWDIDISNFMAADVMKDYCYDFISPKPSRYDGEFIDGYLESYSTPSASNFSLIHLYGQHIMASSRFPQTVEWLHFKSADIVRDKSARLTDEMKNDIASYDNATRYNDHQLGRVIDFYRDSIAVVVYCPDHGDDIYDSGSFLGRRNIRKTTPELAKALYEVPFFVWCSDRYKSEYPEIVGSIQKAVNKPIMTDNIAHILFHLANMTDNSYYIASRDALSDDYDCPPRIINRSENYDVVMGRTSAR